MRWPLLSSVVALLAAAPLSEPPSLAIKVDQVGYLTDSPKIAFVASTPTSAFTVRRSGDGRVVFSGVPAAAIDDVDSGDRVQALDFSTVRAPGTYFLDVPGVGTSWPFAIGRDTYARAYYLTLRSYYGQRCGTAVDLGPAFPGYRHAACHLHGAYHPSSGKTGDAPSAGGWHDAGDYGRYIVNSGIAAGTLLWTWELYGPRLRRTALDIPESGNTVPDILDEIKWNLDWMLTLQDDDGGVWQKQTSEQFARFVMPEADTTTSYIIGTGSDPFESSCATADFAAVMAIAGRTYGQFESAYAARTLAAGRRAWEWLGAHHDVFFRNPTGVATGEYGDNDCRDERLWAASELWRSTREPRYQEYFLAHYAAFTDTIRAVGPPSWRSVAPLALWSYALGRDADDAAVKLIRQRALDAADVIVARTSRSPYRNSMTTTDYIWGSNSVAANYGMQLLVANALKPDRRYVDTALDNLHYLLGRNTFSLSWVTQVGAHPFRHPHHRPSAADDNEGPWPGLLAGGPNRRRQDSAMATLPDLPPAKMYLDEQASYATNEVAINWNAPLVFVLAWTLSER
ncbi:MAG TPA: glycoside hydrolase family 9 protein [Vicinamibacterales bacterium]|nr:glycoside hydrolase family 9 protein [Vicinamibacterales bacterium]